MTGPNETNREKTSKQEMNYGQTACPLLRTLDEPSAGMGVVIDSVLEPQPIDVRVRRSRVGTRDPTAGLFERVEEGLLQTVANLQPFVLSEIPK